LRFAKRSSTSPRSEVAALAGFAVAFAVANWAVVAGDTAEAIAFLGAAALCVAVYAGAVVRRERELHARLADELAGRAARLESLVDAVGAVAAATDEDEIVERTRREAERVFDARAEILRPGDNGRVGPAEHAIRVPLRVGGEEEAALRVTRSLPFEGDDAGRAHVLADFAARAVENARLLSEARVREAERARLSDQLITAEQDERRRLALFLHDTSVQSLAGIALMLDAGLQALDDGDLDQARAVVRTALERQRPTIRSLRELSFNLEPVVLRDQGFAPAVRALAAEVGLSHRIKIEVDVEQGEELTENAQASLYQIIREALHQAIRRGPPTRIDVRLRQLESGEIEAAVSDDAPGERRRRSFEPIEERARTLSGRLEVDHGRDGGTLVRVVLPAYAARTETGAPSGPRPRQR
jgi:signal transduction histidine kinase